jgi:hypothetical protein
MAKSTLPYARPLALRGRSPILLCCMRDGITHFLRRRTATVPSSPRFQKDPLAGSSTAASSSYTTASRSVVDAMGDVQENCNPSAASRRFTWISLVPRLSKRSRHSREGSWSPVPPKAAPRKTKVMLRNLNHCAAGALKTVGIRSAGLCGEARDKSLKISVSMRRGPQNVPWQKILWTQAGRSVRGRTSSYHCNARVLIPRCYPDVRAVAAHAP